MVEKTLQINTCKQISGLKSMDSILLEVCTTFTQAAAGRASKVHKPLLLASLDHRTEPERELSDCPVASTAFWPSSEGSGSLLANLSVSCLLLRERWHCTTLEGDESTKCLSGLAAEGSTRKGGRGG